MRSSRVQQRRRTVAVARLLDHTHLLHNSRAQAPVCAHELGGAHVQEARVERSIGGYRAVERKRGLFLASNLGTAPRFRATVTRGSRKV